MAKKKCHKTKQKGVCDMWELILHVLDLYIHAAEMTDKTLAATSQQHLHMLAHPVMSVP